LNNKIFGGGKSEHPVPIPSVSEGEGLKAKGNSLYPRGRDANSDGQTERRGIPIPSASEGKGVFPWQHGSETAKFLLGCKVKHPAQGGVKSKPLEAAEQFAVQINGCSFSPNPAKGTEFGLLPAWAFRF